MSDSLWQLTTPLPEFPPLSHDEKTDILIVGGGMAGLLCAYLLKQAGADCLLIEANTLAGWTTGKTTAKITAGHGAVYHKLLRRFGTEKARLYLRRPIWPLSSSTGNYAVNWIVILKTRTIMSMPKTIRPR